MICLRWLNSDKLRKDSMDGCCDDGIEPTGSTQTWNFLYKFSGYQPMKETCLAFSLSISQGVMAWR